MSNFYPIVAAVVLLTCPLVVAQSESDPPAKAQTTEEGADLVELLLDQIEVRDAEIKDLRRQLAEAKLQASEHAREATELRQFIEDHREFGDDFARYRQVQTLEEEKIQQQSREQMRQRREQQRAEQQRRREQARAERAAEEAAEQRFERYDEAGFAPLGLNVWISRMGYSYGTDEKNVRVEYEPLLGHYYRPGYRDRIDYSSMIISGSILNSSEEVRNIGVAITFFDRDSNQVGGTTVQINNARPDVPYTFTDELKMALNGPFASSSQHVLYSDPVGGASDPGEENITE